VERLSVKERATAGRRRSTVGAGGYTIKKESWKVQVLIPRQISSLGPVPGSASPARTCSGTAK